jgi:alkylated DNA repair protein (DNA oxidative demethylase)
MGLHRDQDEHDFAAPIVSVSLGLACSFLWGGLTRQSPTRRLALTHGDVLVWGGPSRLVFHGVARSSRASTRCLAMSAGI